MLYKEDVVLIPWLFVDISGTLHTTRELRLVFEFCDGKLSALV